MAMTLFSPYKANEASVTCPRDASFSSYLDTAERDFVRSLAQSVNSSSPTREIFTPRQSVGNNNKSIFRARRSGELDVFGADKYFSEKIIKDDNHYHRDFRRAKRDDAFLERKSSKSNVISATSSSTKSPTPSLKSGRSFNSQIGLLLPKKGLIGHKIFSSFQCKGFCFDKKSISTTDTQHIVQSSSKSYQNNGNWDMKNRVSHQQHFAFPIIDTSSLSLDDDDYQSCNKSMDGFEFHQIQKHKTEQNLDTNHSILSWNAIPNPTIVTTTPFPFPLKRGTSSYYSCNVKDEDECSSDTSSDLFEIETLTGVPGNQTSTNPYYEPSEGSIQWSVVTASDAADNFSDLHDDHHHDDDEDDHKTAITIERTKVQKSSTLGGMFLGCTNRKAIDVVENHYNNQS